MAGGTKEIHKDDDYMISGTHDGADSASTLRDMDMELVTFGAASGLYIENETAGTNATITTATEHEITSDLTWDNGDTYKIYKTASKNQFISSVWVDLSRGWRADRDDLIDGWRPEDVDIDDKGRRKVFGPGQPEPIGRG